MTNVALFSGNKVSLDKRTAQAAAAALRDSAEQGRQGGDLPEGGVYISFSGKAGRYQIGQDKEEADVNELWLINIYGFERGWMCWKGGQPVAKRFASIYSAPVATPDDTEHGPFNTQRGEGWSIAKAITLKSIDKARQGYFSTSTKSAVNEFSKLEAEVARRLEAGEPAWPLVMLDKEKFTAQGQTNYKPILKAYGWIGHPQVGQLSEFTSATEMAENIDRLIEEADDMFKRGVLSQDFEQVTAAGTTIPEGEEAADDGVEDAETVEGDDFADEAVEEAKEEPKREAPRAAAPVRNRAVTEQANTQDTTGVQRRRARI
jgi:hypothetical protein